MRLSQKIFLCVLFFQLLILCVAAQTTKKPFCGTEMPSIEKDGKAKYKNLTKNELAKRVKQDILTMFCSSNINIQYCKNYLLTNNN